VTEVLAVDGGKLMEHRARALGVIRKGFAAVAARPRVFTEELYEDFFKSNPRYRRFIVTDRSRRDVRTMEVATRLIADLDRPIALLPYLRKLALEYRKYGIGEAHYRAFAGSVMTALERTIGKAWTYEAAEAWTDELSMVVSAMLGIAAEADSQAPPYWESEVVSVDRLAQDIVRLKARPLNVKHPYAYRAGQYAAVEVGRLPWVWRDFSFATVPQPDPKGGITLEFHVQRSANGQVTTVVLDELVPGDRIRVSAPTGELAFPAGASRLIAVGHGTGIAPIAALLEEAVRLGDTRPVHLLVGNSSSAPQDAAAGHYLSERLDKLSRDHGNVAIVYAGDAKALPETLASHVGELAAASGGRLYGWGAVAVGSTATVQACLDILAAAGADPADLRSDLFG
jgi:NAD(P)H-flavin reductase/hemoglobin-like flavoprotein